jgi:hypothetical protein
VNKPKIKFPDRADVRIGPPHKGGNLYLNSSAKVQVHCPSIGVAHSIKCVEYFEQKGEPVPKGTPTVAQVEAEWRRLEKQRKRKSSKK